RGVGLGTSMAEWVALGSGLWLVAPHLHALKDRARLGDPAALKRLFAVNGDIMIRTVALLMLFSWFANAGARMGATPLAANQVLMQAVALVAFILDGFAFTAESRVGHALGAGSRAALVRAIRLTGEFSLGVALLFGVLIALLGAPSIRLLVVDAGVREQAIALLPLVVILPLIGFPAWLLDGIFIGATQGRALRNAAIVATALYILTDLALRPWGATGIWVALLASYVYRAVALGWHLPGLLRRIGDDEAPRARGDVSADGA
ncbi:MAG: family efflux transporter, partial [Sphingomonas bacterium]|uniref:MATE family efflux transporter n=1 Tax=Sphingomonas bacterium TaxID=1895847 RepID=UPI00261ED5F0